MQANHDKWYRELFQSSVQLGIIPISSLAGSRNNSSILVALEKVQPLHRLGSPEDVANALIYLNSQESNWITGQILNVDDDRSTLN